MGSNIKRLIAQERRCVWGYTWRLWTDIHASRAERARWRGLRAYHQGQMERWRNRL